MTNERLFPIQSQRGAAPHPIRIPWSIAELAYSVYSAMYGRSQSLERLAERGGFGPNEMDMFLPDWREQCSDLAKLCEVRNKLMAAIVEHHAQKADDRCVEDDDKLYAAANLPPCDRRVGSKEEMLANCKRFIDRRCEGGGWPTYAELEAKIARLENANKDLSAALATWKAAMYEEHPERARGLDGLED